MTNFKLLRNKTECKANVRQNKAIDTLNRVFNNKKTILKYLDPFTIKRIENEVDLSGLLNIFINSPIIQEEVNLGVRAYAIISNQQHRIISTLIDSLPLKIKQTSVFNLGYMLEMKNHEVIDNEKEFFIKSYKMIITFYKTKI